MDWEKYVEKTSRFKDKPLAIEKMISIQVYHVFPTDFTLATATTTGPPLRVSGTKKNGLAGRFQFKRSSVGVIIH